MQEVQSVVPAGKCPLSKEMEDRRCNMKLKFSWSQTVKRFRWNGALWWSSLGLTVLILLIFHVKLETEFPAVHLCLHLSPPVPQHVCVDCKKNYCSGCSAQQGLRPRLCHTCQRFYGNLLERAELMKLKVKELRDYLHLHEVSTHLCREKVTCRRGFSSSQSESGCRCCGCVSSLQLNHCFLSPRRSWWSWCWVNSRRLPAAPPPTPPPWPLTLLTRRLASPSLIRPLTHRVRPRPLRSLKLRPQTQRLRPLMVSWRRMTR